MPDDSLTIPLLCAISAALGFLLFFMRFKRRVRINCGPTAASRQLASSIATVTSHYAPPMFLINGHIHTVYASLFRKCLPVTFERAIITTPDGGCLSLDWLLPCPPPSTPVLLLLHGLTGGSHEPYMKSLVSRARGSFRVVCLNMRGAASSTLTTATAFSAEVNCDVRCAVEAVSRACPGVAIVAAGFSLGANILLRYLGDPSSRPHYIKAAVSICNPLDLQTTSLHLSSSPLGRLWSRIMARNLIRFWSKHALPSHPDDKTSPLAIAYPDFLQRTKRIRSVYDFDQEFVCPMFGHESPEAYYRHASCHRHLHNIACPVLFLSADDDPITGGVGVAPGEGAHGRCMIQGHPRVYVSVLAEAGGHCGFLKGWMGRGGSWGDDVIVEFLNAALRQ
jgi:predicted alpha/beta-fold hydrolase